MGELYRTDLSYLAVLKYIIRHTLISNLYFIVVAIYVIRCKVKAQPPDLVGAIKKFRVTGLSMSQRSYHDIFAIFHRATT